MSRYTLILLSLLFTCGITAYAGDGFRKDKNRIIKSMVKQVICWNNGDIPCFMEYYWQSDSLKFVGKSGITYGWQNTLDRYLKKYPDKESMGLLAFEIIHVEKIKESLIMVTGSWKLQRKEKSVGGYYTLFWKKVGKEWYIIYDHTS